MAQKYTSHSIRGTLTWAKVLPDQLSMNDFAKEKQWSVDVAPDAKGMSVLKELKLAGPNGKVKDKKDGRGQFISFRQSEFKKDGAKNDPIKITDSKGNDWPTDKKIGNGSVADVKFSFTDFGAGKYGSYIKAIRVLKHVPYVAQEFAPLSEDDEYFQSGEEEANEPQTGDENPVEQDAPEPELDDEVPF